MTPEQISIIVGAIFGIVAFSVSLAYTIKAFKKEEPFNQDTSVGTQVGFVFLVIFAPRIVYFIISNIAKVLVKTK